MESEPRLNMLGHSIKQSSSPRSPTWLTIVDEKEVLPRAMITNSASDTKLTSELHDEVRDSSDILCNLFRPLERQECTDADISTHMERKDISDPEWILRKPRTIQIGSVRSTEKTHWHSFEAWIDDRSESFFAQSNFEK